MIGSLGNRTVEPVFGDQVGRYKLVAELARGGMGIVYLASTTGPVGFRKLIALKQLRPELVEDQGFLTMFLDEARVAARLGHPNIVQTNDVEQSDGRYFIAMEYLDGRSFSQIIRRFSQQKGFPLHMSLVILRDVLGALDYAHSFQVDGTSRGVVHRDISPQNIFVTFDGCTKVIDFGIAKAHDSVIETKTGVLKGKVQYMAPEQLLQKAEARSDLFSVGAVMFEVVTGNKLWAGFNELEIMQHLARFDVPAISTTLPNVPPVLLKICRTALCPEIEDRYVSAAKMRDAIDEYLWSARITPQSREVGEKLLEEFGGEREARRVAVEAYLARQGEDGIEGVEPAPLQTLHPSAEPPTREPRISVVQAQSMLATQLPSRVQAIELGTQASKSYLAGAALLLASGGLVGFAMTGTPPAHVQREPTPPPRVPPRPRPAPMIDFAVSVTPASARVLIDGEPMPSNPFLGHFPRDTVSHRVRATAPGYASKERAVSFADNVMVDLSLDPHTSAPAQKWRRSFARVVPPTVVRAPPPPVVAPPPVHIAEPALHRNDGRRAIDASNPYGEDQ